MSVVIVCVLFPAFDVVCYEFDYEVGGVGVL